MAVEPGRWHPAKPESTEAMDCREFLLRYSDYDDSLIPPQEADRFRSHMSTCPACARYDRVLRKGRMLARQLPTVEPSPDFMPRLRRRLFEGRRRRRFPGARLATGLAAATVLMVAAAALELAGSDPAAVDSPRAVGFVSEAVSGSALPRTVSSVSLPSLPAAKAGTVRGWAGDTVASEAPSSYSPLVTGPPAYRAEEPTRNRTFDSDRRALD